ncbi:MAG: aspartate/glutamate racemase family protein [Dehalococcoidia bacterium]
MVIFVAKLGLKTMQRRAMKILGLIGGMSWNPTLEYYRIINESFARRRGGLHSARLVLYKLDFDEVQRAQHEGRWDDTTSILVHAAKAVKKAGADLLVLCTNTMHQVADVVEEKAGCLYFLLSMSLAMW